jgi:hypothetical protein
MKKCENKSLHKEIDRDVDHDVGLVTNGPRAGVWKVYTRKKTKRTGA